MSGVSNIHSENQAETNSPLNREELIGLNELAGRLPQINGRRRQSARCGDGASRESGASGWSTFAAAGSSPPASRRSAVSPSAWRPSWWPLTRNGWSGLGTSRARGPSRCSAGSGGFAQPRNASRRRVSDMLLQDPQKHIGSNVRIRPHGRRRHFGRGRLIGIEGKQAVVQPFQRHRQLERVPLEDIHTWAAGNAQPMETPNQPTSSQTPAEVPPTPPPPAQTAPTGDKLFTDGPWVVADVTNAKFFVSSWAGFKPELESRQGLRQSPRRQPLRNDRPQVPRGGPGQGASADRSGGAGVPARAVSSNGRCLGNSPNACRAPGSVAAERAWNQRCRAFTGRPSRGL